MIDGPPLISFSVRRSMGIHVMHRWPLMVLTLLAMAICPVGCGQLPLVSENRKNFAPWEKLPEGNGVRYLEKLIRDPGHDPLYLAKISYDDEAALQKVLDTFGLVPDDSVGEPSTWTGTLDPPPKWFPLPRVTNRYVFPIVPEHDYVSNLWVDKDSRTAILERTWW
jgi:hypothetical protein